MTNCSCPPETQEQRKARQYATLHTLGELGLELARGAHAQAKKQLAIPPDARSKEAPDYVAVFASLSRAVRQAIALEIRLDAPARIRPPFRLATRLPDPRRILLRRAFHAAIAKTPDAPSLRREIDAQIDQHLDADPDQQIPIEETIATLCNALAIDLDLSRVPDALLGIPPARAAPATPG